MLTHLSTILTLFLRTYIYGFLSCRQRAHYFLMCSKDLELTTSSGQISLICIAKVWWSKCLCCKATLKGTLLLSHGMMHDEAYLHLLAQCIHTIEPKLYSSDKHELNKNDTRMISKGDEKKIYIYTATLLIFHPLNDPSLQEKYNQQHNPYSIRQIKNSKKKKSVHTPPHLQIHSI